MSAHLVLWATVDIGEQYMVQYSIIIQLHSNIYTIIRHVQETSEILSLSTVFLQPVELVTTCTLTMLGALEVVRAAYCAL